MVDALYASPLCGRIKTKRVIPPYKKNGTVEIHSAILFYFMTEINPSRVLA